MIRNYIIETLTRIKKINGAVHSLYKLGVDILNFDTGVDQLEKSIPLLIRGKKDEAYTYIDDLVGWWLYEEVEKIITLKENIKINLEKVEDFTDYLIKEYQDYENRSL